MGCGNESSVPMVPGWTPCTIGIFLTVFLRFKVLADSEHTLVCTPEVFCYFHTR